MKRTATNLNSCDPRIPASVSPLHLKWQTLSQSDFFHVMPAHITVDTSATYNRNRSTENPIHGFPMHQVPNGLPVFMGKSLKTYCIHKEVIKNYYLILIFMYQSHNIIIQVNIFGTARFKLEGKNHLGDLGIDGIILKWILEKEDGGGLQ